MSTAARHKWTYGTCRVSTRLPAGYVDVVAWRTDAAPGLAATRAIGKAGWVVTHLASGCAISTRGTFYAKSLPHAKAAVLRLAPFADWTQSADALKAWQPALGDAIWSNR